MAQGIRVQSLAVALLLASGVASGAAGLGVLAGYSFDDGRVDTGPDTFAVFQNGKGTVTLTDRYRMSGYQAVEIREEPGDDDFAELQGYFEKREKGRLYFHFALLTATPRERLNIALAGPAHFGLRKDGIAFWLTSEDGWLRHTSDSIPKKLFRLRAFTWYGIDVRYDIGRGTYDLLIRQEGESEPVASLKDQPNATRQAGSAVDKFSFIGDLNESSVVYYIDDVMIAVDGSVPEVPFVAPGRKKLFADAWLEGRKAEAKPRCPSTRMLSD
ncbi:MAG TPA: hypothetical protein VM598_14585, partial [Bdellovibrionota bacterium]|nr:hypothetical protein [Bdellovibrionota bacterium]